MDGKADSKKPFKTAGEDQCDNCLAFVSSKKLEAKFYLCDKCEKERVEEFRRLGGISFVLIANSNQEKTRLCLVGGSLPVAFVRCATDTLVLPSNGN